ncbi:MAG: hypothetical protein IKB29_00915 [Clostridia bacterium]|nr:hypothetical protein [Clostridia bacterium]
MNNDTSEQKKSYKKLIKNTFVSEFKSEIKKIKVKDFIFTIIGFLTADIMVEVLHIDFWLLDIVASILIIILVIFVLNMLNIKFKK